MDLTPLGDTDQLVERPRVEPGQWLDCSDRHRTQVGCFTCGWYDVGPDGAMRTMLIAHNHDPEHDIEARAKAGRAELADVLWLLDRLRSVTAP